MARKIPLDGVNGCHHVCGRVPSMRQSSTHVHGAPNRIWQRGWVREDRLKTIDRDSVFDCHLGVPARSKRGCATHTNGDGPNGVEQTDNQEAMIRSRRVVERKHTKLRFMQPTASFRFSGHKAFPGRHAPAAETPARLAEPSAYKKRRDGTAGRRRLSACFISSPTRLQSWSTLRLRSPSTSHTTPARQISALRGVAGVDASGGKSVEVVEDCCD